MTETSALGRLPWTRTRRRILAATLELEAKIGELNGVISRLADEQERQELARALGDVIGIISEHLVRRIAHQHPELDPDR